MNKCFLFMTTFWCIIQHSEMKYYILLFFRDKVTRIDDVLARGSLEILKLKIARVNHIKVYNKVSKFHMATHILNIPLTHTSCTPTEMCTESRVTRLVNKEGQRKHKQFMKCSLGQESICQIFIDNNVLWQFIWWLNEGWQW